MADDGSRSLGTRGSVSKRLMSDSSSSSEENLCQSHLFVFAGDNKAGMNGIDKGHQAKVIYDMSKNSNFFKHAEDLDKRTSKKVEGMKDLLSKLNTAEMACLIHEGELKLEQLEVRRSLRRICAVLDMDMFFAAVEIRDRPQLKDLPVAIGGMSMISTSNYVARRFGVRAAMPGFIAKKLCPDLIFLPCNFKKYEEVSEIVKKIIGDYDKDFRSWSLDEVYFDLTEYSTTKWRDNETTEPTIYQLRSIAFQILHEIRQRITVATEGLTCSAGLANNFFLAKICADINKPDGQFQLEPSRPDIIEFISSLPTRKVGGIGKVLEKMLADLGMKTMGDVRQNIHKIIHTMTPATTEFLCRTCIGISEEESEELSIVAPVSTSERKSLGAERTFEAISSLIDLRKKLYVTSASW